MTVPDFSKIWASQSPLTPYEFSDEDYLDGWEFIGEIPPDRRMFDTWQKQADTKMLWLKNNRLGYLLRQNSKVYEVGDIAFSPSLPSSLLLLCTAEGTTAATAPDFSGAVEGGTVTDGTVVWTYKTLVGGGLDREQIPAFNHRDVITTSGTYTAPVDGWYKITVKGGGGGGAAGIATGTSFGGGGGGEGGTTIAFEKLTAGDTVSVVIGAGGTSATNGGDSSVTVGNNTYTGGGGSAGSSTSTGGLGGSGTIAGAPGGAAKQGMATLSMLGASGGGAGGAISDLTGPPAAAINGGGGAGGLGYVNGHIAYSGGAGGDGFAWFEYFAEV